VANSKPNAAATSCVCVGSFRPSFNASTGALQSCDLPASDQGVPDFVTAVSGQGTQIKPLDNDVGRGLLIGTVSDASKGGRLVLAANKRTVTYLSAAGAATCRSLRSDLHWEQTCIQHLSANMNACCCLCLSMQHTAALLILITGCSRMLHLIASAGPC
jgi:hypothetical protein